MGFSEPLFPTLAAALGRKGPEYSNSRVVELGLAIALTMEESLSGQVRYYSSHSRIAWLPGPAWLLPALVKSRRPVRHNYNFLTAHRLLQAFTGTDWHSLSLGKNSWPAGVELAGSSKPSQVSLALGLAGSCRASGPCCVAGSTDHERSTTPALTKASRRRTILAYESATEARPRATAEWISGHVRAGRYRPPSGRGLRRKRLRREEASGRPPLPAPLRARGDKDLTLRQN